MREASFLEKPDILLRKCVGETDSRFFSEPFGSSPPDPRSDRIRDRAGSGSRLKCAEMTPFFIQNDSFYFYVRELQYVL